MPRQTASGQAKPEQGTWAPTPNAIGTNGFCTPDIMSIALKSNLHDIYLRASQPARLFSNGFSGGRRIRSTDNLLSIPTAFAFTSITKGVVRIERSWRSTAAAPKHLILHRSAPPAKPARRNAISYCPDVGFVPGKVTMSPIYSLLLTRHVSGKA